MSKFITCKNKYRKEELIQKGFKLLNQRINSKNETIYTFVNKPELSNQFSKNDNVGLEYTNVLYFN